MIGRFYIREKIQNNKFVKSVFLLTGASGLSQAIVFLASPLIARLYSPEDFGVFAVYSAALIILGVISSLRYQLAIPICRDIKEAADVIILCCLILLCITLVLTLAITFLAEDIKHITGIPDFYLWLFPASFLLSGFYQIIYYYGIKEKKFSAIAKSKITQVSVNTSGQIFGYSAGAISLGLAQLFGFLIAIYPLYRSVSTRYKLFLLGFSLKEVTITAKKFKKFPIFSTWHGLFNSIGQQFPNLVFAIYFSPTIAGLYFLADKVLAQPMNILGRSISDVFFAKASDLHDILELKSLVINVYDVLIKTVMPVVIIIACFGEQVFTFIFGGEWAVAGEIVSLLSPSLLFGFITSPLMMIFTVLEKQEQALVYQLALVVTRLAGLGVGIYLNDFLYAVIGYTVASVICRVGVLIYMMRLIKSPVRKAFSSLINTFCVCVTVFSPLLIVFFYSDEITYSPIFMPILGTIIVALWYYKLINKMPVSKDLRNIE